MGASAGSLNVTGQSTLHGAVTAGALLVTGSSVLSMGVTAGTLNVTGTSTLIGFVTSGSILINTTTNALNGSAGGSFTVLGGASIVKSLYANTVNITPSLGDISAEVSFTAGNNISTAANVTGLSFSSSIVRSFNALVSVTIIKSVGDNMYANFELKGIQKASSWAINSSFVGDATGIVFSIDTSGQVKYTSPDIADWTSTIISFRALTTSI
jgi:hypothetical protein